MPLHASAPASSAAAAQPYAAPAHRAARAARSKLQSSGAPPPRPSPARGRLARRSRSGSPRRSAGARGRTPSRPRSRGAAGTPPRSRGNASAGGLPAAARSRPEPRQVLRRRRRRLLGIGPGLARRRCRATGRPSRAPPRARSTWPACTRAPSYSTTDAPGRPAGASAHGHVRQARIGKRSQAAAQVVRHLAGPAERARGRRRGVLGRRPERHRGARVAAARARKRRDREPARPPPPAPRAAPACRGGSARCVWP